MQKIAFIIIMLTMLCGCGSTGGAKVVADPTETSKEIPAFSADSAFAYVKGQTDFGPRVPGSDSHAQCREWLVSELQRHGAAVHVQEFSAKTFDGKSHRGFNIIGQYNPVAADRLLLLAHWDSRPWADKDPDPAKHSLPVSGANDGASGVGVLLEIARILNETPQDKGVDILFVDLEDSGDYDDENSWALGSRHFANNPFKEGYRPAQAILLDMVGAKDAVFAREYLSAQYAPQLLDQVWRTAAKAGYADRFVDDFGGAVTDDHVELIKVGIPAIDIIENYDDSFSPVWHTADDTIDNIDPATLGVVGKVLTNYIYR